jgi:nicotinamide-nucleotide amidase
MTLVVTSGGLGPTADDLTAEVVGRFAGREMVLDDELEQRIAEILRPLLSRWPDLDPEAIRRSNRKQAVIPAGAAVLGPVGTAPGLVVPPTREGAPTVVVLPGPPRELQPMWRMALETAELRAALAGAPVYERGIARLFGIPESEIAATLEAADEAGLDLDGLEITTCLRRGEIEVSTRYEPAFAAQYRGLVEFMRARHGPVLFSPDGETVDELVARLLAGRMVATAESCTAGLLAARLTERAGSSDYFAGGLVVYSNEAKIALAGVDPALLERFGAVSVEVAEALARGALVRFGADFGVGITGIAGPGGGTPEKPVGTVCFSVVAASGEAGTSGEPGASGEPLTRRVQLPGDRFDIRDRSTTIAMHMLRRVLIGARSSSE